MNHSAAKAFKKHSLVTLAAVYFLILVGSIVRTTGSGMGCPDWPKCFGNWVPPTSVEQLPPTYKEDYTAFRLKKNVKFASFLQKIGMKETADQLLNDKSVQEETDFNATKTWIEYVNRLVGVVIGLLIILLVVKSFRLRSEAPGKFWMSCLVLVVVLIQGWFGSIVVATNLTSWTITIHMLLAFVLIAQLVWLYDRDDEKTAVESLDKGLVGVSIVLLLVQVYFGTQVRAWIDSLAYQLVPRGSWMDQMGAGFILHRSFSWVVLLVNAVLFYRLSKTNLPKSLLLALIVLILSSVLTGVGMAYGGVPAWLQPLHLLVATMVFGVLMLVFFKLETGKINGTR